VWDIAISDLDDLVYSPNRDFLTVSGIELLHQRIMLRLKMKRGSWIFDDTKELGSNLDFALRMNQPEAMAELDTLVVEALDPIRDEITILRTEIVPTEGNVRSLDLIIVYQRVENSERGGFPESENLVITIPIIS